MSKKLLKCLLSNTFFITGFVFFASPVYIWSQNNIIKNGNIDSVVVCDDGYEGVQSGACPYWNTYGEGEITFMCEGSTNGNVEFYYDIKTAYSGTQYLIIAPILKRTQSNFLGLNWSEIITSNAMGTFSSPLIKDQRYEMTVFVSEMGMAVNSSFVHIFTNCFDLMLLDSANTPIINNQQYANIYPDSAVINLNPSNELIKDSINWVKLSTCFIAKGNEKFFAVGCFRDTTKIATEVYKNAQDLISINTAVYGIDSFSLFACDTCCGNSPPIPPFEEGVLVANNPSLSDKPLKFTFSVEENNQGSFSLYDSGGKLVEEAVFPAGVNTYFPSNAKARGIYMYRFLSSTGFSKVGKVIVME